MRTTPVTGSAVKIPSKLVEVDTVIDDNPEGGVAGVTVVLPLSWTIAAG